MNRIKEYHLFKNIGMIKGKTRWIRGKRD